MEGKVISDNQFIGRAENQVFLILESILYGEAIQPQVPLGKLIDEKTYESFDIETKQHKFDFAITRKNDVLVVEVNYKHGPKASRKWIDIFVPHLKASKIFPGKNIIPVAINDWDCKTLFKHQKDSTKPILLSDVIDVCNALITSGVKTIS